MHRRRRSTSLLAVTLGLVFLVAPSGATADTTTTASVEATALAEDAQAISHSSGRTVTRQDLERQQQFSVFADWVIENYPDVYSDARISDSGRYVVYFKTRTPDAVRTKGATLPFTVYFRTDAKATEVDMLVAQEAAVQSLAAEGKTDGSTISFDAPTETLEVVYVGSSAESATVESTVTEAVEEAVEEAASPQVAETVEVDYTVLPASQNVEEAGSAYGGAHIVRCTSGFTAVNGTYNGIITADHCSPTQSMEGDVRFTNVESILRKYGDVRFMRTSSKISGTFRYWQGKPLRTVTGTLAPKVGAEICHYGATTGGGCDRVHKGRICRGDYCGLVALSSGITAKGDSGGPWYQGSKAVGVHSGRAWVGGFPRSVYTPVANVSTIGVSVHY